MTPIPAKVLVVAKQSSQYRVIVQIELDKDLGSFRNLRFGETAFSVRRSAFGVQGSDGADS